MKDLTPAVEEKQNIDIFFIPLPLSDIEEKIRINQQERGYTLIELKELLEHELHLIQRNNLYKKYLAEKVQFSSLIQEQNLKEQIACVNNKIIKELQCQSIQRQL